MERDRERGREIEREKERAPGATPGVGERSQPLLTALLPPGRKSLYTVVKLATCTINSLEPRYASSSYSVPCSSPPAAYMAARFVINSCNPPLKDWWVVPRTSPLSSEDGTYRTVKV